MAEWLILQDIDHLQHLSEFSNILILKSIINDENGALHKYIEQNGRSMFGATSKIVRFGSNPKLRHAECLFSSFFFFGNEIQVNNSDRRLLNQKSKLNTWQDRPI